MDLSKQRIYKYQLEAEGRQMLQLPKGAEVLSVMEIDGFPFLYVAVDPTESCEPRVFRAVTTGDYFNRELLVYVGSVRLEEWYIMHLFEVETALRPLNPDPIDTSHEERSEDRKTIKDNLRKRSRGEEVTV